MIETEESPIESNWALPRMAGNAWIRASMTARWNLLLQQVLQEVGNTLA